MSRRTLVLLSLLAALTARGETPPDAKVLGRYKQMLERNPGEGTALERLWKAYLDQNQTADLLDEYKAGGSSASELVLGYLLKKAGRNDEALAAFNRAAKLDGKNPLPPLAVARLQSDLGHPRESAEAFERAVALLPADDARLAETLLQLGSAWLAAGDAEKAADAWERTVALNPGDLELHRRLADTYAQNRLTERAIRHLDYLDAHAPPAERALALQQLARIQQGAGNQDAAIAALEKALSLTAPGNWLRAELARSSSGCTSATTARRSWKSAGKNLPPTIRATSARASSSWISTSGSATSKRSAPGSPPPSGSRRKTPTTG